MERIVLEVKNDTAQKWQQASAKLKQQAAQMVERLLTKPDRGDAAPTEEESRKIRVLEAQDFFGKLSADFTGYKFDREEANERLSPLYLATGTV